MSLEHLLTDNPEAIAFGRARIRALRAAGVRYATQVYDTPFGRVKVRIVGDIEYIHAESANCRSSTRPRELAGPAGQQVLARGRPRRGPTAR